jgi:hypothetical protein
MDGDITHLTAAIVTLLAPYTPYLLEAGKAAGQKWIETIAEQGGEATWNKAKVIWEKIHTHFGDDTKVKGAALIVSADPDDASAQTALAKVLGTHLQEDPRFAQELLQVLGGTQAVQEVLANQSSWVEEVTQEIEGTGIQTVGASEDSIIKGVRQTKK